MGATGRLARSWNVVHEVPKCCDLKNESIDLFFGQLRKPLPSFRSPKHVACFIEYRAAQKEVDLPTFDKGETSARAAIFRGILAEGSI